MSLNEEVVKSVCRFSVMPSTTWLSRATVPAHSAKKSRVVLRRASFTLMLGRILAFCLFICRLRNLKCVSDKVKSLDLLVSHSWITNSKDFNWICFCNITRKVVRRI